MVMEVNLSKAIRGAGKRLWKSKEVRASEGHTEEWRAEVHTWGWSGTGERDEGKPVPGVEVSEGQADDPGFLWKGTRV